MKIQSKDVLAFGALLLSMSRLPKFQRFMSTLSAETYNLAHMPSAEWQPLRLYHLYDYQGHEATVGPYQSSQRPYEEYEVDVFVYPEDSNPEMILCTNQTEPHWYTVEVARMGTFPMRLYHKGRTIIDFPACSGDIPALGYIILRGLSD